MRDNHDVDVREVLRQEDDERRALERLLHDGAQQTLVALAMTLQLAEHSLPDELEPAAAQVAGAPPRTAELVDELPKAANPAHSPLLDQEGLLTALRSVAEV